MTLSDYDPVSAEYSIFPNASDNECAIEVTVVINDDSRPEPQQCFNFQLQSSDPRVITDGATAFICIVDNDGK